MPISVPTTARSITTGNYTGNASGAQRQITTGYKCSLVVAMSNAAGTQDTGTALPGRTTNMDTSVPNANVNNSLVTLQIDSSNGFNVGGDGNNFFNENAVKYYYWAISQ